MSASHSRRAFTLVELSIVLVIIGLIVGGVMVGKELISSAALRSTIAQMEKYQSAMNAFRGKYNALPGDIAAGQAASFGFYTTGTNTAVTGKRDGNGLIESSRNYAVYGFGNTGPVGETLLFWRDLTNAGMIDGNYGLAMASGGTVSPSPVPVDNTVAQWLPPARLGNGNYIVVFGTGGQNYFNITAFDPTQYAMNNSGGFVSKAGVTPSNARDIDTKLDDGQPITGTVVAVSGWGTSADSGTYPSIGCIIAGPPVTYDVGVTNGNQPKCEVSVMIR